jgi:hypothetical protein
MALRQFSETNKEGEKQSSPLEQYRNQINTLKNNLTTMTDVDDAKKHAITKLLDSFSTKENLATQKVIFPPSIPA